MLPTAAAVCVFIVAITVGLCSGKSLHTSNEFTLSNQPIGANGEVTQAQKANDWIGKKRERRQADIPTPEDFDKCSDHGTGTEYIEPSKCPAGTHRLCAAGSRKASYCFDSSLAVDGCVSCDSNTFIDTNNNCTVCKNCTPCGTGEEVDTPCSTFAQTKCRPITPPSDIKLSTSPVNFRTTTIPPKDDLSTTTDMLSTLESSTKTFTENPVSERITTMASTITSNSTSPNALALVFVVLFFSLLLAVIGALLWKWKQSQTQPHINNVHAAPGLEEINLMLEMQPRRRNNDAVEDGPNVPLRGGANRSSSSSSHTNTSSPPPSPTPSTMTHQVTASVQASASGTSSKTTYNVPGPSYFMDDETETQPTSFGQDTSMTPIVDLTSEGKSKGKHNPGTSIADDCDEESSPLKSGSTSQTRSVNSTADASKDVNQLDEVEPDHDGYYHQTISPAWPTREQAFDKEVLYYEMKVKVKGFALVINNRSFPNHPIEKSRMRPGSEVDLANMIHLWEELSYKVEKYEDLRGKEILQTVKDFSAWCNDPKNKCNSAVIVLMSHGSQGFIHGTDLEQVPLLQIQEQFDGKRCPYLKGKPKVFIYQACRWDREANTQKADQDMGTWSMPEENADMFFANATTQGRLSLRDTVNGSWYVQALCEVFLSRADEDDLDKLMTKVNSRVTKLKGTCAGMTVQQTPEHTSRLTKSLHFLPKYFG